MAVLAVDARGTGIKLGLVEGGRVLARQTIGARADQGLVAALPRIAKAPRGLTSEAVHGVGLAFPSLIDGDRVVGDAGKYRDAPNVDLAVWARNEIRAPSAIENDARLATLGGWRNEAGRGATNVVMVTLGIGIGTGVVSEGRVLRGHLACANTGNRMAARIAMTTRSSIKVRALFVGTPRRAWPERRAPLV